MKFSFSLLFLLSLQLLSFVQMKKINKHLTSSFCLEKNSIVESKVKIGEGVTTIFHTDDCCSKSSRQAYVCFGKLTSDGSDVTWVLETPCNTLKTKAIGIRGDKRTICN